MLYVLEKKINLNIIEIAASNQRPVRQTAQTTKFFFENLSGDIWHMALIDHFQLNFFFSGLC